MATYRKFDWNRARKDFATLFTDFFGFTAGDWVVTTVEAGGGAATEAVGNEAGGVLVITNDNFDNDADWFQWAGGAGAVKETFKFAADKKLQFVGRFKLSSFLNTDFMAGLYVTDTDPIGGVTDGIYFRSLTGTQTLQFVVEKNSTETVIQCGTIADDTYFDVEFYWDANGGKIDAYVNGTRIGAAVTDNAPDDEELALSFGVQNGSAAAHVMSVDYVGAQQQR